MTIKHTHRTHENRTDFELAAIHVLIALNGMGPVTPAKIEECEAQFRGVPQFEKALREAADIIKDIAPEWKAERHECKGQLCDQDGKFKTKLILPPDGSA